MDKQTKEEKIKEILKDMEVLDRYYEDSDLDIAVGRILNSLPDMRELLDEYWSEQRDKDFHDDWVSPNFWLDNREATND